MCVRYVCLIVLCCGSFWLRCWMVCCFVRICLCCLWMMWRLFVVCCCLCWSVMCKVCWVSVWLLC